MENIKLDAVLVPKTTFQDNVRSLVKKSEWDKIRRECYKRANYKCEICGGVGKRHPVECHEVWEYEYETSTQRLVGLQSVCPSCHKVKHLGFAFSNGFKWPAIQQLRKVNNWTKEKTFSYIEEAFEDWERRSEIQWTVDISYLEQFWQLAE